MRNNALSVRVAKRPLVALLAVAIITAPLVVAPASAQGACGTQNGFWTSISAPRFKAGPQALVDHAVDARSPNHMYVTNGTAVMLTRDSGCTWDPVYVIGNAPAPDRPYTSSTAKITSIVVPEAVAGRVLLTVEETAIAATRPHVVVSSNRGASWQLGDSGLPPVGSPEVLVVAPSAANIAYLGIDLGGGTVDSLFASADGGLTWQPRAQRVAGGVTGLTVDPLVPSELWAHGPGGLSRSTDGGVTFAPVDEFVGESAGPLDIFHGPGTPARIFAFVPSQRFMLASIDGGETWQENYSPGTPDSVAHGAVPQNVVASSGGDVFGWAQPLFQWIDLRAPHNGVVDLVASRSATPGFYGRTATTIEIYQGPDATEIVINDPDFDIGDVGSLIDLPDFLDPSPPQLDPETNKIRIPAGETRKQTYRLALSKVRTPLDVYLVIDTSSSMRRFLKGLAHALAEVIRGLEESRIDVHFGIAEYRAYPDSTPPRPRCDTPQGELLAPQCENNFVYHRVLDVQPVSQAFASALKSLEALGGGHYDAPLPALLQTATGAGDDLEPPGPLGHDVPPGLQANFRDKAFKVVLISGDEPYRIPSYGPDDQPPDRPTFDEVIAALNGKGIHQVGLSLGAGSLKNMRKVAAATGAVAPAAGVDCDGDGAADLSSKAALVCSVRQDTLEQGSNLAPAIVNLVEAVRNRKPVTFTAEGLDNVIGGISPDGYPGVALQSNQRLDFTVTYRCPQSMAGERTNIDLAARDGEGVLAKATTTVICGGIPEEDPLLSVLGFDVLAAIPLIPVSPPPTIVEPASSAQAQSQAQAQGAMAQQRQEQHQVARAHNYKQALRDALAREDEYAMSAWRDRTPAHVPAGPFLGGAALLMSLTYAYAASTRTRLRYRFNFNRR